MSNQPERRAILRAHLTRRDWLNFASRGAAGVVVSQSLLGEFTSLFFFDETLTDTVHALAPYRSKGTRDVLNARDGIYDSLAATQKTALTLQTSKTTDGYAGVIDLGVQVG